MAMENVNLLRLDGVTCTKHVIGKGAYGRVLEVSTVCAAKEVHQALLDMSSPQELAALRKKFLQECVQCSKLYHPNIVQFLGIYYPSEDAKLPWLVMEKMEFSLKQYLENHKPSNVSFQVRMTILHDISLGLQYLHVQDIIHRDLSSNNVLLTKRLVAKIADLGVAKVIGPNHNNSCTQAPGTTIFMPPEALSRNPNYGKPVDVFSLGCVTIHVMTHVWPEPKDEARIDEITGEKIAARSEIERREDYLEMIQKPTHLKEIILKCLKDSPTKRPTINNVSTAFRKLHSNLQLSKMQSILFDHEAMLILVQNCQEKLAFQQQALNQLDSTINQRDAQIRLLQHEKEILVQSNSHLSEEVARLMKVDESLREANNNVDHYKSLLHKLEQKSRCKKCEEQFQAKYNMVSTYKQDFGTEHVDREGAHNIKEKEIMKLKTEKEQIQVQCEKRINNLEGQMATYKKQASYYEAECERLQNELKKYGISQQLSSTTVLMGKDIPTPAQHVNAEVTYQHQTNHQPEAADQDEQKHHQLQFRGEMSDFNSDRDRSTDRLIIKSPAAPPKPIPRSYQNNTEQQKNLDEKVVSWPPQCGSTESKVAPIPKPRTQAKALESHEISKSTVRSHTIARNAGQVKYTQVKRNTSPIPQKWYTIVRK